MSDGLMKISRKRSVRARFARSVPSSVMATKWFDQFATPALSSAARKCAASEFGSIVPPDLLARMYSVVAGGVARRGTDVGSERAERKLQRRHGTILMNGTRIREQGRRVSADGSGPRPFAVGQAHVDTRRARGSRAAAFN